jgi:hypothetical protein
MVQEELWNKSGCNQFIACKGHITGTAHFISWNIKNRRWKETTSMKWSSRTNINQLQSYYLLQYLHLQYSSDVSIFTFSTLHPVEINTISHMFYVYSFLRRSRIWASENVYNIWLGCKSSALSNHYVTLWNFHLPDSPWLMLTTIFFIIGCGGHSESSCNKLYKWWKGQRNLEKVKEAVKRDLCKYRE